MGLPFVCLAAHGFRASSMARGSDFGKCQTFAASPAEPGELPLWFSKGRKEQISGTPKQADGRCAAYLSSEGFKGRGAPMWRRRPQRVWVANGSAALMAGAAGWPCDGPSPTQGKPGGVPVVPYPPRLLLIDAIPWVWENDKKLALEAGNCDGVGNYRVRPSRPILRLNP